MLYIEIRFDWVDLVQGTFIVLYLPKADCSVLNSVNGKNINEKAPDEGQATSSGAFH